MNFHKLLLILIFLGGLSFHGMAQDYKMGIGLRAGLAQGFTIKPTLGDGKAVDVIVDTRWRGWIITGLFEIHKPAFDVEGMTWYYGGGGHIGFWRGYTGHPWFWQLNQVNRSYTVIGVDGVIGLEYDFRNLGDIPFTASLDYKPAFNIIGYTGFWADGGALSIRYVF